MPKIAGIVDTVDPIRECGVRGHAAFKRDRFIFGPAGQSVPATNGFAKFLVGQTIEINVHWSAPAQEEDAGILRIVETGVRDLPHKAARAVSTVVRRGVRTLIDTVVSDFR
jgi:hypothetical protein